jgi:hypothetical protein
MRTIFLFLICALATAVFAADESFKAGGLTFQKPASFKSKPASGMRAAQLEYTGADGKTAEAVFFAFGGGGGGVQANVDRWLAQFEEPKDKINSKVEKKKVGEKEVTYVEAEGTYNSGMPGGPTTPKPGTKLLGAIVEGPEGNVFARMTGPIATMKTADADFRKMIESALK